MNQDNQQPWVIVHGFFFLGAECGGLEKTLDGCRYIQFFFLFMMAPANKDEIFVVVLILMVV